MILETERLILRKPRKSDWKDLVEGVGDFDVAKITANIPHPYRKKDAVDFIGRTLKDWRKKKKDKCSFLIELKDGKKVIGGIVIFDINPYVGIAKTGSWISKKHQRKGYITEAKIAINEFAFNKLKLRRLWTVTYSSNKASNAVQKSVGYKLEGKLRKHVRALSTNKIYDAHVYGIMKADWKKILPKLRKKLKAKIKRLG